ncbi:PorT family protein [Mucilaginibacter sp. BJC16-A38]|uniref:porin family protein n=1 Tax=Mucilaginibacter phenanthrenivorans TaxID=1234842 RepID=UPI002157C371|nr:porin family protein [Mucilaginibacter phenanthrenivorans]MCR8561438.1 PorT family protein [Mucilaginibacter phenanthrenivorans]
MKKIITTLLVVLGIYTAAFSQTKGATEFGINVGLNESTVTTGDNQTNSDYRVGFNVGVSADYYFSDHWSFKAKVVYDQKGWNNGYFDDGTNSYTVDYKLNYITIPLMANWHFGRTRNWYLNFGPYIGILTSAKLSDGGGDVKDFFNTTDGGLDVGIGVKIPVSDRAKFFIELNGQGGVSDMVKDNTGSALRNSTSNINIGINF